MEKLNGSTEVDIAIQLPRYDFIASFTTEIAPNGKVQIDLTLSGDK